EGVRSGADWDFSWRLQEAGWTLAYNAGAVVEHHHRATLAALSRQIVRYGSSRAWLVRRYPGSCPPLRPLHNAPRGALAAVRWALGGDFERASYRLLDSFTVVV